MKEKQRQLLVRMWSYRELIDEEIAAIKRTNDRGNGALETYRSEYNRLALQLAELQFGLFLKKQTAARRRIERFNAEIAASQTPGMAVAA